MNPIRPTPLTCNVAFKLKCVFPAPFWHLPAGLPTYLCTYLPTFWILEPAFCILRRASSRIPVFAPRRLPVKVSGRKKFVDNFSKQIFYRAQPNTFSLFAFDSHIFFQFRFSLLVWWKNGERSVKYAATANSAHWKNTRNKLRVFPAKYEQLFFFSLMIYSIVKCARLCPELMVNRIVRVFACAVFKLFHKIFQFGPCSFIRRLAWEP